MAILILLLGAGWIFLDDLVEFGANYAIKKVHPDFKIRLSNVATEPLSLKTSFSLNILDRKTGKKVVKTDEVNVDLNFEGGNPTLDLKMNDLEISLTKTQLGQLVSPKKKQNASGDKKFNALDYLGSIELRNMDLNFTDGRHTLFSDLRIFDLDFRKGQGSIKGIRAMLPEENLRIVEVKELNLEFNTEGILGEESARLGVAIQGTRITLAKRALEALKDLLTFPNEQSERDSSALNELSYLRLHETRVQDLDRHLAALSGYLEVNFSEGKSILTDVRADWTHTGRKLLSVGKLSSTFSKEDLLKGNKPDLSLILTNLDLHIGKELRALMKARSPKDQETSGMEVPVTISQLLIGKSSLHFPDYPGVGRQPNLAIREIYGNIRNLTFTPGTPLASFNVNATFEGKSKLMANGRLDLAHTPPQASVDYRLFDFDMTKLNRELRARLPLSFRQGEFDLLGEIIKRDKDIVGYFKPFLEEASYLGNRREFLNIRHFFNEIGATISNWLLENSETKTVSTQVPFIVKDGNLDFQAGAALWRAVEHGLIESKRVKPRTDKYRLRQAEEERKAEKIQRNKLKKGE